ncbi:hypothetical protein QQ045_002863 [Rhodiola kirilowii]
MQLGRNSSPFLTAAYALIWPPEQSKIVNIATDYFENIFQSSLSGSNLWEEELDCIRPVISEDMNEMLLEDISDVEVRRAVFSMNPLKAPGLDGFPALFYQKNWNKISRYIIEEVRKFWEDGVLDDRINKTLIVLIPKKPDADRMEDLRPISLCSIVIKIITKILAFRLQSILDQVVSCYQSSFIKGRIITDNFIIAHEISHFLKSCKSRKDFYASIKVDISKAYDRVEWPFLEQLMLKMRSAVKWINRVMHCVRSVTYQVKVNDCISKKIIPNRGLRQGDPLSPYLFLLCSELLSAKMSTAAARQEISGIRFGSGGQW